MAKLCTIEGCSKPHEAHGLCALHNARRSTGADLYAPIRQKRPQGSGRISHGYLRRMVNLKVQMEHVRIAEKALGRQLPAGAQIHHLDEDRLNNSPTNLIICPDVAYHRLLHIRTRALQQCGHADWRKCYFCGHWDAPDRLFINSANCHHRECINRYYREKRKARNG